MEFNEIEREIPSEREMKAKFFYVFSKHYNAHQQTEWKKVG